MVKIFLANLLKFTWAVSVGASGYKIRFGPGDGTYPSVIDVGNAAFVVTNDNPAYRAAVVTAYGTSGLESAPSAVLVYRPPPGTALNCSVMDGYQASYEACQTTVFQLNDLVARLKKTCGKRCAGVK